MSDRTPGQIITFYSYKGGTGRTMALANVACLLARRQPSDGRGVLMMDWDLEAPGLHRYFRSRGIAAGAEDPADDRPGLIDLFIEIDKKTDQLLRERDAATPPDTEALARAALDAVRLDDYIIKTEPGPLYLMKAGRFERKDPEAYSARVNTFRWDALYEKSPKLIRVLAERLAERYQYVLIDSRTGITDVSGICTMLLPEKLVVVFTPNRQSILGGLKLITRATEYRRESSDLRPLVVFPLASRVEANEPALRKRWRFGDGEVAGYEPLFEKALKDAYRLKDFSLRHYFDEMQIQQIPRYAYGEEIAVLAEEIEDRFSLKRSYGNFAAKLAGSRAPWLKGDEVAEADALEEPGLSARLLQNLRLLNAWVASHASQLLAASLLAALALVAVYVTQANQYRAATDKIEAEHRQLKAESENLKRSLDEANGRLAEVASFTTLLDQNKKTIDELNTQLTAASADRDQARYDILRTRSQLEAAIADRDQARQDAQRAKSQLAAAKNEAQGNAAMAVRAEVKYQELLKKCGRSGE